MEELIELIKNRINQTYGEESVEKSYELIKKTQEFINSVCSTLGEKYGDSFVIAYLHTVEKFAHDTRVDFDEFREKMRRLENK